MKNETILIGAHVSIKGGLYKAIEEGERIGCNVIQIFTKSSRSWFAKKLTPIEIDEFKEAQKNSTIKTVVAHASYLINLGSPKKEIEEKSIQSLSDELFRCEKLNIPYLVLHPGAHLKNSIEDCIKQIAKNLEPILKKASKTMILLETTAGQGTNIGYTFEQLREIIDLSNEKNKLGVCLDTCHIFSAGYDISSKKSYDNVMSDFEKVIGFKNLKVIHINDSKTKFNSRKDRHANIGKGTIGLEAFKLIMNDKRLKNIPKILETPIINGDEHQKEIELLKKMVK